MPQKEKVKTFETCWQRRRPLRSGEVAEEVETFCQRKGQLSSHGKPNNMLKIVNVL